MPDRHSGDRAAPSRFVGGRLVQGVGCGDQIVRWRGAAVVQPTAWARRYMELSRDLAAGRCPRPDADGVVHNPGIHRRPLARCRVADSRQSDSSLGRRCEPRLIRLTGDLLRRRDAGASGRPAHVREGDSTGPGVTMSESRPKRPSCSTDSVGSHRTSPLTCRWIGFDESVTILA